MLLFLPQLVLGATLLILIASNLFQRSFRSSWLLATTGAALALISLVFLRLRLPLTLSSSAWWAGEGMVSSINFQLDGISWQFALIACALAFAFFLLQVHTAITEPWLNWAAGLAIAISSLLAIVSGDLLTVAFFWILVDATTALFIFRFIPNAGQRRAAFEFLPANMAASFLLMAASVLTGSGSQQTVLLVLVAAAFRLEIFSPTKPGSEKPDVNSPHAGILRLLPKASVLVLLARTDALSRSVLFVVLALLFFSTLVNTMRWLHAPDRVEYFERGFASLALFAAAIGQPGVAVLGFGLVVMIGSSILNLMLNSGRYKWLVLVPVLLIFSGLPFSHVTAIDQSPNPSWSAVLVLPLYALLIAGWLRLNPGTSSLETPREPWMRTMRWLGLFIIPSVFLISILIFSPSPAQETEFVWWPALVVLVLSVLIFLIPKQSLKRYQLGTRWKKWIEEVESMVWMQKFGSWVLKALDSILRIVNRVLEGQAGILWALLLITLLLSVASQFAFGG